MQESGIESDDRQDAERWRFVRDVMAKMHSPKMNGQHSWRFAPVRETGATITEAIDEEMKVHAGEWKRV